MPEYDIRSNTTVSELRNFSNIIEIAIDRLAIERACQLIDNHVQELWQQASSFDPTQLRWPTTEQGYRPKSSGDGERRTHPDVRPRPAGISDE
jgi:hypothetical protein